MEMGILRCYHDPHLGGSDTCNPLPSQWTAIATVALLYLNQCPAINLLDSSKSMSRIPRHLMHRTTSVKLVLASSATERRRSVP